MIANAFARARLVTRCEPEPPALAGRTTGPAAEELTTAGMYWARPCGLDQPALVVARLSGRFTALCPCRARSAGRTNISNETNTLTGFPGRVKIGVPSTQWPNPCGLPGCIRTGPNHTPSGASTALTTS